MSLEKEKDLLVLFCPKSEDCAVFRTWHLVQNEIIPSYDKVLVEQSFTTIKELIMHTFNNEIIPNNKFVLAHGSPEDMGFISLFQSVINNAWWSEDTPPSNRFGLIHACKGSRVLTNPIWNTVFNDWVSYSEDLEISFGLKTDERWKTIFLTLFDIASKNTDGTITKSQIIKLYNDEILFLRNQPYGTGARLMIMQLTIAINCIKSKYE